MAIRERNKLKNWFKTGDYPNQEQFWDWIDSFLHKSEDQVSIDNIQGLRRILEQKADQEGLEVLATILQGFMISRKKIVRQDVLLPLTDQDLNQQYPKAVAGTQVICPLITEGGELYEKYDDISNTWFRLYMTKGLVNSPGKLEGAVLENFVDKRY